MGFIEIDDLIFYKNGNNTMTGGMQFNNFLKNNNMPAMIGGSKGATNNMENITIPIGLVLFNNKINDKIKKKYNVDNALNNIMTHKDVDYIGTSLYDKLLNLYKGGGNWENDENSDGKSDNKKGENEENGDTKKGGAKRRTKKIKNTRKKKLKIKLKNKTRKL